MDTNAPPTQPQPEALVPLVRHAYISSAPPAVPTRPERRVSRLAGAVGVAVLSATIASASTVGLLSAFGISVQRVAVPAAQSGATDEPGVQLATDGDSATDLTDIVAIATQSVVTITSESTRGNRFSPFGVPSTGVGSGVVVTASGLILTNSHVVENARRLTVTTADGQELPATVVSSDPDHDIAVIRALGGTLVPATLGDSAKLEVGQTVLAIGSPLGEFTETVTRGIVSALDRSITVADQQTGRGEGLSGLIQTDAAINPGNSGGALINERGEVIGMNTAIAGSAQGIGFAIPINAARQLIDQAVTSIG